MCNILTIKKKKNNKKVILKYYIAVYDYLNVQNASSYITDNIAVVGIPIE